MELVKVLMLHDLFLLKQAKQFREEQVAFKYQTKIKLSTPFPQKIRTLIPARY